jgi:hypothetical protein
MLRQASCACALAMNHLADERAHAEPQPSRFVPFDAMDEIDTKSPNTLAQDCSCPVGAEGAQPGSEHLVVQMTV